MSKSGEFREQDGCLPQYVSFLQRLQCRSLSVSDSCLLQALQRGGSSDILTDREVEQFSAASWNLM